MTPAKLSFLFVILSLLAFFFFFLNMIISTNLKETKMTVYFQDWPGGPNATVSIVTGIPNRAWSLLEFGTIYVFDDPITKGPDKNSPEIGRAQGLFASSSLDGVNSHGVFSIMFTNKEYNDSTLEIQGRSRLLVAKVRELSVVGGTGKFRFASGYATFETLHGLETSTFYSVIRCNITVLHP